MRAFVENMQTKATWKSRLHKWGYKPLFCSVESKSGLDSLAFILREQTSVIVGPSGVGKSSLINALRNSDHHAFDAAEVDNRLDQVGFYLSASFYITVYHLFVEISCSFQLLFLCAYFRL